MEQIDDILQSESTKEQPFPRDKKFTVCFEVSGRKALFCNPITKTGKEKSSYSIPTPSALIGLCKNIYWKPTIDYEILEFRVMNQINFEPVSQAVMHYYDDKRDLSIYKYLKNVRYQVKVNIIFNNDRPDLAHDYTMKHLCMFERAVKKGGRCNPVLGVSECPATVSDCTFGEGKGYYDDCDTLRFGVMCHTIEYTHSNEGTKAVGVNLYDCTMRRGVITVPSVKACAHKDFKGVYNTILPMEQIEKSEPADSLQSMLDMYDALEKQPDFFPKFNSAVNAAVTIVLTKEGDFCGAYAATLEDQKTAVQTNESSMVRSNGVAPHYLTENAGYILGYDSENKGIGKQKHMAYMEQLSSLKDPPKQIRAVVKYLEKNTAMDDIAVLIDEEGKIKGSKAAFTEGSYIRFQVGEDQLWKNKEIQDYFAEQAQSLINIQSIDYLTGSETKMSLKASGKLRFNADAAKLVSSNDSRGFAFASEWFSRDNECVSLGYENFQKTLSVLRWLIGRQGVVIGNSEAIVTWNAHPEQDYGRGFTDLVYNWSEPEYDYTDMHYMVLDVADGGTKGRISIVEEGFLPGSEALDNIRSWYSSVSGKGKVWSKEKKEWVDGSPSLNTILEAAYGHYKKWWSLDGVIAREVERKAVPDLIKGNLSAKLLANLIENNIRHQLTVGSWEWIVAVRAYECLTPEPSKESPSYRVGRLFKLANDVLYRIGIKDISQTAWQQISVDPAGAWRYRYLPLLKAYRRKINTNDIQLEAEELLAEFENGTRLTSDYIWGYDNAGA